VEPADEEGLPAQRALQAARQILGGPHLAVLATANGDGVGTAHGGRGVWVVEALN
jgi:hypothetical protein